MASEETIELLTELGRQISVLAERVPELEAENQWLKAMLQRQGEKKGAKAPKFRENYSVDKNQGEQKSKRGRKTTGRRAQNVKLDWVSEHVTVYEQGVPESLCIERRLQYGWRFIDRQAKYICYHLYARSESKQLPEVAGLRNHRSEYGVEIILTVACLHYWTGISLDHVCSVVQFFTGLALSKSQANARF